VAGVARSDADAGWLRAVGAKPVQVDLLDPAMVRAAVANAMVHLATAIPPLAGMRRPGAWQINDRLRTHANRNLVDAAIAAGAEVFVRAAGWEPGCPSVAAGWPTVGTEHRRSA
jgi:hypothetical protein